MKRVIAFLVLALLCARASATTVYSTDFSNFSQGDDQWAGRDGWLGNSVGSAASGIASNLVAGYGNSGWIGFGAKPGTNLVSVSRPISNSLPVRIHLEAVIGATFSTTGSNDIFDVSFYNTNNTFLGGLRFDTTFDSYGLWVDDSVTQSLTAVVFNVNQLYLIDVDINYQSNVWSCSLNGVPIFQNAHFTSSPAPHNAGLYAFEWELTDMNHPGDNWLFVDNVALSIPGPSITNLSRTNNAMRVSWLSTSAGACQVQFSSNLVTWSNLSGSLLPSSPGAALSYLDQSATNSARRFYRILE